MSNWEKTLEDANKKLGDRAVEQFKEIERLTSEVSVKDDALVLAWDALRWADGPNEGLPSEKWTEIPRDEAIKAFAAVWDALGRKNSSVSNNLKEE